MYALRLAAPPARMRTMYLPGLIDWNVSNREPGATYKEDWTSISKAALAGGITMIGVMPDTNPPVTNYMVYDQVDEMARRCSCVDYGIFMAATRNSHYDIPNMEPNIAGLKMHLNDTQGREGEELDDLMIWENHIKKWSSKIPITVHAERVAVPAIIHMAALHDKRVHICHVSKKEEIEVIRASKEKGYPVTCDVTPHHLLLDTKGTYFVPECKKSVVPKLGTPEDRAALFRNMKIIDMFSTDHSPHTIRDKSIDGCPGFPGLETAIPLLTGLVKYGFITVDDIIQKYHHNPRKIFHLPNQKQTEVEIQMDRHSIATPVYSKSAWTPYKNFDGYARVRNVKVRGKLVVDNGVVIAKPGSGRNIRKKI